MDFLFSSRSGLDASPQLTSVGTDKKISAPKVFCVYPNESERDVLEGKLCRR